MASWLRTPSQVVVCRGREGQRAGEVGRRGGTRERTHLVALEVVDGEPDVNALLDARLGLCLRARAGSARGPSDEDAEVGRRERDGDGSWEGALGLERTLMSQCEYSAVSGMLCGARGLH